MNARMTFDLALAIELIYVAAVYSGSTANNDEASYDALRWGDSRPKPTWQELQDAWEVSRWPDYDAEAFSREVLWKTDELVVISEQLLAIEEFEAGSEEANPLPGTRTQWLQYRTKVRNWIEGAAGFPEISNRPVRPS